MRPNAVRKAHVNPRARVQGEIQYKTSVLYGISPVCSGAPATTMTTHRQRRPEAPGGLQKPREVRGTPRGGLRKSREGPERPKTGILDPRTSIFRTSTLGSTTSTTNGDDDTRRRPEASGGPLRPLEIPSEAPRGPETPGWRPQGPSKIEDPRSMKDRGSGIDRL